MYDMGRLTFRAEGYDWNAYYVLDDAEDGTLHVGSIKLALIAENEARRNTFINLMRECVADIIEDASGERPQMTYVDVH